MASQSESALTLRTAGSPAGNEPTPAGAKRRLAVYLAVTFGLTWATLIPAGIALGTFRNGVASNPSMAVLIAVSMFFPLIGALVANFACGKDNRIDLCLRPRIGENIRYYLAAWFGPAVIALVGGIMFFATNPNLFDLSFAGFATLAQEAAASAEGTATATAPSQDELAAMAPLLVGATVLTTITIAPFINTIPSFGEEVGWRGMLFPTLCELMPLRAAVIVSGAIWGIWHAPVIAMGHNYGMGYAGFPWTGILVMTLACTVMGSCMAYLRLRTQSVWPCALAHGAFNAISNVGVYFCLAGQTLAGPSPLGFAAGIPLLALGIACLLKMQDAPCQSYALPFLTLPRRTSSRASRAEQAKTNKLGQASSK